MTQQPAPPPDRGALRAAIEGLLRTCVDLERQADGAATDARKRVRRIAETVAAVRLPRHVLDVPALAQQVDGLGRHLDADLRGRLASARQPYVTEIHALLALLAPWHGLAALPPLGPAAPGAALTDHFPTGFAQDYVIDLLGSVDASVALTPQAADQVPVAREDASDAVPILVGDQLHEDHRQMGVDMLQDGASHAVQRHGPHIAPETQLARLLWLKDPSGDEPWRLLPNGGVESNHWCGPIAGGFTSAEAMAKPIDALLRWARVHAGGLNGLLTNNTKSKTKRISIYVSAESAGLVPGDANGYRGTATSSRAMTDDWLDAREHAMAHGAPPIYAVPYDPIAEGKEPGAFFQFKRVGASSWSLVTCFPVGERNLNCKRMEDLT
ncbi:hypothetical protein [Jiangella rhizosphaerae]|uniref:Uncharacterized protein n=1 Tax=Jiangella rhizosphaerae TaxID=2293569 RepID=A0A418KXN7_9ACTN|nr:hypothetical protein [Jiangella rhizosphaerae]RIQ35770.1 hypothetical protein DY240_02385 [Jiangella rhizosphaerae]